MAHVDGITEEVATLVVAAIEAGKRARAHGRALRHHAAAVMGVDVVELTGWELEDLMAYADLAEQNQIQNQY